ncbi:MAG: YggS family pyridoxal phosphate-dependent enzyme [Deferrisomatales bacterium]
MGDSVARRLGEIRARIAAAARAVGRDPAEVCLVAVTKTVGPEPILAAHAAGQRVFGESYVQEALAKIDLLPPGLRWHMIGHLQSNKARRAVEVFASVECLDRPSLADALQKAARARGAELEVLLQVNVGGEDTKHGATFDQAAALAARAPEWPNLKIRGLMAIPPYRDDPEESRRDFRALRELRDRLRAQALPGVELGELSMGMSHDYAVAVEEGATRVRVGTALFGERAP